ncbi:hypothetical protein COOONC_07110, partial [Cooperia oncophora]
LQTDCYSQILTQIDISQELEKTAPRDAVIETDSEKSVIADEPLKRKGCSICGWTTYAGTPSYYHETQADTERPYFRKMKQNSFVAYVEMTNEIEKDSRKRLGGLWTSNLRLLIFLRFQPLGLVREYFGEQIAFYFAWQGTFLTMLWPATFLGLAVFAYGMAKSIRTNPATYGNCTLINYYGETEIVACSIRSKLSQLFTTVSSWFMNSFDNELNAFFAAFMSIWGMLVWTYLMLEWGTMFYQIWRRNNTVLAYEWDCEDFNLVEPDRPEYQGTSMRTDPVTGQPEYFSPVTIRIFKYTVSCIVVVLSMCLVIFSVFLVTVYKLWAVASHECGTEYTFGCSVVAAYIPAVMNTVSTMILGSIYEGLVVKLTQWGKFNLNRLIKYVVHAVKLRKWYKGRRQTMEDVLKEGDETNVLVREWIKPPANNFSQGEFNEKSYSIRNYYAPLLALIIGVIDLRIDALRLLWLNRRPIPAMASGIGIWLPILYFLQYAAVMTNAFIIAFTSDFCSNFFSDVLRCDVKNRFLIVIVFRSVFAKASYQLSRHQFESLNEGRRARNAKLAWVMSLAKGHGELRNIIPREALYAS